MLWDASAINGYAIEASDGRLGTVSDLLFEDDGWIGRWLVVDAGNWLSGRKVLLPLSALGKPDEVSRHFPVKLTMQQVKDSPDVDTERPVSRQMETHFYDYWSGGSIPMGGVMAPPFIAPLYPLAPVPRDHEDDPHLRSIAAVTGYHIHATDGGIGHVEDLLINDADWRIRYVVVDTRNWLPGHTTAFGGSLLEEDSGTGLQRKSSVSDARRARLRH